MKTVRAILLTALGITLIWLHSDPWVALGVCLVCLGFRLVVLIELEKKFQDSDSFLSTRMDYMHD